MERSREARRLTSMTTTNGLPRRRHRSNSLRDSPEEGQVELQETVRLRDRASKRDRDRERERERELLSNKSKRRRGTHREEGEESTEESDGDDEEEYEAEDNNRRNINSVRGSRQWKVADEMIGVQVPRKARSASAKRAHENWVTGNGGGGGVAEEQSHLQLSNSPVGSPSSSNITIKKKTKAVGPKTRAAKVSKNCSSEQEDIEIEIAEVLFGLKKQSQSSKKQETNGNGNGNSLQKVESKDSNASSILPHSNIPSDPSLGLVGTKKKKMEAENSSAMVQNSSIAETARVESGKQPEKMEIEISSPKPASNEMGAFESVSLESHKEAVEEENPKSGMGDENPVSAKEESPPCVKLGGVDDDLQNSIVTKRISTVSETESKREREEKFEIDLMAPPPMSSSPDREPMAEDVEAKVKQEEKPERFVKKETVMETAEQEKKMETIGEKRKLGKRDLEKPNQDSGSSVQSFKLQQHLQAKATTVPKIEKNAQSSSPIPVAGWPGGFSSLGYIPPFQTAVPMDKIAESAASLQSPHFLLPQPRPKRCVTHHYIARNVYLHQQFTKMNHLWPAPPGSASLCGAKPNNLNVMPAAEKIIFGNPLQGSVPRANLHSVQDKWQNSTNFPGDAGKDKSSEAANFMDTAQRKQLVLQQAPQSAPAGSLMHGPAFIFPMNQHPAIAAGTSQAGPSKPASSTNNASLPSNVAAGPLGSSSVLPAVATALSFNYPNVPPNESPYLAILPNNGYPFPISTPIGAAPALRGGNPAQAMPFFNGPFYSSQMFHPSQLQQQQPHLQPQVQTTHQNTSTSSGSSSSHKQPRGAQVSGNNFLTPANLQLQQAQKLHLPPSHQSRKLEAEMSGENIPSIADTRASHAQKSVYGQNLVPVHPLNFTLMPSAALAGGGGGGNHGEKQQQGLKGTVDIFPSPAFAMSFASFNGNNNASTLNFSSMAQNPAIYQSLPEMARQGYQIAPAPQGAQQKNHQVSEGKTGGGSTNPDDAKKSILGKSSTTTAQTLVFDNSARTLSFMSSPVTGNWPSRSIMSTTITTNAPIAGNASSSEQQMLQLQLQLQKQHMLQQQQSAVAARSKAPTTKSLPPSSIVGQFPNNPPVFSQTLIQCNSSVQSSQLKNTGRTPASQVPVTSFIASSNSSPKNSPQQKGRAPHGHTQISFGGSPKSALAPQGQQMITNNQSSSNSVAAPQPTGGNLRTNSTGSKAGSSISQQPENSSTGNGQKSSPACGRNVPSILSSCPSHLSELKY